MIGTQFAANIIQSLTGPKAIQITMTPVDSALSVSVIVDAASARNVARILVEAADKAERVIVMPSHDSVPPAKA